MQVISHIGAIFLLLVTLTHSQTTQNTVPNGVPDTGNTDSGLPIETNPSDLDLFAVNSDPFTELFGNSVGIDTMPLSGGSETDSGNNNDAKNNPVDDINNKPTGASSVVENTVNANIDEGVIPPLETEASENTASTKSPVQTAASTMSQVETTSSIMSPVETSSTMSPVEITSSTMSPVSTTKTMSSDDTTSTTMPPVEATSSTMRPVETTSSIMSPVETTSSVSPVETTSSTMSPVETTSSTMSPVETSSAMSPVETPMSPVVSEGTPVKVTAAPSPQTSSKTAKSWTYLCEQCHEWDQTCNFPHPSDCQMFIECFRQGSGWAAVPMLCGQGTFFSRKENTSQCDHVQIAECQYDRCSMENIDNYKHEMDKNCATYWECDARTKMSKATCCPEGQAYIHGYGCVEDENCTAQCPNTKNITMEAVPEDLFTFKEDGKCNTNVHLNFNQATVMNESPKQKVVFIENGGTEKVQIKDGHGYFNSRSFLSVPYYNHNAFQIKKAFIQLRFKSYEAEQESQSQVLVSTCSSNYESGTNASLEIKLDKPTNTLLFTGDTENGIRVVKFDLPYRPDHWNKVQFIYDGINTFTALVQPEADGDRLEKKEVVMEGISKENPLKKPTMNLRIGSCSETWRGDFNDYFHGEMDDVYIASCVPDFA